MPNPITLTRQAPRARRFAVELRCRYRETGTLAWHEGRTTNISLSGVLFNGEQVLPPKTEIEMIVTLPVVLRGVRASEIHCRAVIIREQSGRGVGRMPLLAASIERCRVVRGSRI